MRTVGRKERRVARSVVAGAILWAIGVGGARAGDCPEEPLLLNWSGGGKVVCPCFITGEQAGSVLDAPADHYPIEVLRIGIGWGSQFGGAPTVIEQAIHLYGAGLPDPGLPIFTLKGPQLVDGFINEFDVEGLNWIVNGGPFTVTLEFLNSNSGDPFAPSVVHDGQGCDDGENVVFAIPGGWFDACDLGVTGDWLFQVTYRQVDCGPSSVDEELLISSGVFLQSPQPNPFSGRTEIVFRMADAGSVDLSVHDLLGRRLATLASGYRESGLHRLGWTGARDDGTPLPAGTYFLQLTAGSHRSTRKITLGR